jgi:hypothetical protein
MSPITPPPITNHTGLISVLKSRTRETRAIKAGIGSKNRGPATLPIIRSR